MRATPSSFGGRLRDFAVLGRISNWPTIPSNCLAGWLLGGGGSLGALAWVCVGGLLIYAGGMFLNDAVDADWDRRHRPERPIPAGRVVRRQAWIWAVLLLASGWLGFWMAGTRAGVWSTALVGAVVFYDLAHKRFAAAPLLMAGCRGLLYTAAGAAGAAGVGTGVWLGAMGMAGYVGGLSFLARGESAGGGSTGLRSWWPWLLVATPLPCALGLAWAAPVFVAAALFLLMVAACSARCAGVRGSGAVSGLLAGIPLADAVAAAGSNWRLLGLFLLLAVLARGTQRLAPAT